ncbi:hypothetical protein [Kitasatospora sp. NPDC090091]|uniref:hypothetical protein n=1 Tax=Kitasatospora sp. NPDC090091 TaxID=3364081 RepID=UPI00380C692B
MTPDQTPPASADERLHAALRQASRHFAPHSPDLVLRAAARGRRLRLVRRVQLGAAAAAVAGVSVLGAVQLSPQTAAPAAPAGPVASATGTASNAPAPTGTAAGTTSPTASAPADLPTGGPRSGPIADQLAAFLPPGPVSRATSHGSFTDGRVTESADGNPAGGSLVYDDGSGAVTIDVLLLDAKSDAGTGNPSQLFHDVLPDGTVVAGEKTLLPSGYQLWQVSSVRPDGRYVAVSEVNTDQRLSATPIRPTRAEPPLSLDRLKAIALSPHWRR